MEQQSPVTMTRPAPIQIVWKDLSYEVSIPTGPLYRRRYVKRKILQDMDGEITGGKIMALMGPSGAGKSTLLKCISRKLTNGVSGKIYLRFPKPVAITNENHHPNHEHENHLNGNNSAASSSSSSSCHELRIGFVPQQDCLFTQFTLKETLMFASRMLNSGMSTFEHKSCINELLLSLDLLPQASMKLNKLSGGQLRRASIATELVSNPKVLILDEPTTGLDSDNSEIVISMIKSLSEGTPSLEPPAIIATIHQPSIDVFMMFDNIYLLNRFGANIYHGPPQQVSAFLMQAGFTVRQDMNPADYMIEVANAKHGCEMFDLMAKNAKDRLAGNRLEGSYSDVRLSEITFREPNKFGAQVSLLWKRDIEANVMKSVTVAAKMISYLIIAITLTHLFATPIGERDGCWKSLINLTKESSDMSESEAFRNKLSELFSGPEILTDLTNAMDQIRESSMMFFLIITGLTFLSGISVVMIFPSEFHTIAKEVSNSWYCPTAFYVSKQLADFPVLLVCTLPAVAYAYFGTGFPSESWRFIIFYIAIYMASMVWHARGTFLSIIFHRNPTLAILSIILILFPMLLGSGFAAKSGNMNSVMERLSVVYDLKFCFEAMLSIAFGFGRCDDSQSNRNASFFDLLSGDLNPTTLFPRLWTLLNVTSEDAEVASTIIEVDEKCMNQAIRGIEKFFGNLVPVTDGNVTTAESSRFEPSFLLYFLNVEESSLTNNLTALFVTCVLMQLLVYLALRITIRTDRL